MGSTLSGDARLGTWARLGRSVPVQDERLQDRALWVVEGIRHRRKRKVRSIEACTGKYRCLCSDTSRRRWSDRPSSRRLHAQEAAPSLRIAAAFSGRHCRECSDGRWRVREESAAAKGGCRTHRSRSLTPCPCPRRRGPALSRRASSSRTADPVPLRDTRSRHDVNEQRGEADAGQRPGDDHADELPRAHVCASRLPPRIASSASSSPSSSSASRSGCRAPRVNTMCALRVAVYDERTSSQVAATPISASRAFSMSSLLGRHAGPRALDARFGRRPRLVFLALTGLPHRVRGRRRREHARAGNRRVQDSPRSNPA